MKLSAKHILLAFLPVVLLASAIFALKVFQYKPLYPESSKIQKQQPQVKSLPVFNNDPILGKRSAPKTIVTFEDLSCPACKDQYKIFTKLINKYPQKVKVVWKNLTVKKIPISSKTAHRYSFCLKQQGKFNQYINLAFTNHNNLTEEIVSNIAKKINADQKRLKQCLDSDKPDNYLKKNKQLAKLMNVQSVPSVFINGKEKQEPKTLSGWESLLNLNNNAEK